MRTTTLTITIEARADASESRIREALMADLDTLWQYRHGRSTEDGKPVTVVSVEPHETVERLVPSALSTHRSRRRLAEGTARRSEAETARKCQIMFHCVSPGLRVGYPPLETLDLRVMTLHFRNDGTAFVYADNRRIPVDGPAPYSVRFEFGFTEEGTE